MPKKDSYTDVLGLFAVAMAKANGHPDPAGWAEKVKAEFEAGADADPVSQEQPQAPAEG